MIKRLCLWEGCTTSLSVSSKSNWCSVHSRAGTLREASNRNEADAKEITVPKVSSEPKTDAVVKNAESVEKPQSLRLSAKLLEPIALGELGVPEEITRKVYAHTVPKAKKSGRWTMTDTTREITDEDWSTVLSEPWPERYRNVLELLRQNQERIVTVREIQEKTGVFLTATEMDYWFDKFDLAFRVRATVMGGSILDSGRGLFKRPKT